MRKILPLKPPYFYGKNGSEMSPWSWVPTLIGNAVDSLPQNMDLSKKK
jgi:hypothetical protein